MTFAAGGVDYIDDRISRDEQKKRKADGALPFGQVPILEVDGRLYSQSYSIAKYAAKLGGLLPADPLIALYVEQIVDSTDDVRSKYVPIRYMPITSEQRLAKYSEFFGTTLPSLLANFEKLFDRAGSSGFLVGESLTLADIAVFNMCDYLTSPSCEVQAASEEHTKLGATCLNEFPRLQAHQKMVAATPKIAEWLAKRPRTPHDNISTLKDDYNEEMTLEQATILATKILAKSMDMNRPNAERFEIGVVTKDAASGKVLQRRVEGAELETLLSEARVFEDIEQARR